MTGKIINGLADIINDYDLFLIDQWGVLHDGFNAHSGAITAMENMRDEGKKVIILSNSGKRLEDSYQRMDKMGINKDLYDHVVTSGENVYQNFKSPSDSFYKNLGKNYFIFTWDEGNKAVIKNVGKQEVNNINDADFILCTGTNQGGLDYYLPLLQQAISRNIPLICANHDLVSQQPDGSLTMCPGSVAKAYEKIGGNVRWHGKPTREIYNFCKNLEPQYTRILGIGDSLNHDIKGANDAGGSSLFILGGIHNNEFSGKIENQLSKLSQKYNIEPTYILDKFIW